MIRFVDLTESYWCDNEDSSPICAFLNTVSGKFVESSDGGHTFVCIDDFAGLPEELHNRLRSLIPPGFMFGTVVRGRVVDIIPPAEVLQEVMEANFGKGVSFYMIDREVE